MKKTLFIAALAATLLASPAVMAADALLPNAPTSIEQLVSEPSWTGPYAGAVGVVRTVDNVSTYGAGIVAGYNYQIDAFLVGAEVSLVGLDEFNDVYGQITGKAGVVVTDNLAVYGLAGVEREFDVNVDRGVLGGGVAVKVANNLNLVGEYQHKWDFDGVRPDADEFRVGLHLSF